MKKSYPKLYTRNANGSINVWWAEIDDNSYTFSYGQMDGKIQTTKPIYCEGKNIGKSNETSPEQQAIIEIEAEYIKHLKQNYFHDIKDIDKAWKEPMLCKLYKDYRDKVDWPGGWVVDEKLNGTRCIIRAADARSRKNEVYHAIPHINNSLEEFFKRNKKAYLDGELFNPKLVNHLNRITELVSVGRKQKDLTDELLKKSEEIVQFHCYDAFDFDFAGQFYTSNDSFLDRRRALYQLFEIANPKYVFPVRYKICYSEDEMIKFANQYIVKGGEGVIIKYPGGHYEFKRTKNCLKYKKSESEEFKVISVEEGSGNWAGCAKFVWCELPNGLKDNKFKSNISGAQDELRKVFKNRNKYVGKMITVNFQEYSEYNTPIIPYTDMLVRDYE